MAGPEFLAIQLDRDGSGGKCIPNLDGVFPETGKCEGSYPLEINSTNVAVCYQRDPYGKWDCSSVTTDRHKNKPIEGIDFYAFHLSAYRLFAGIKNSFLDSLAYNFNAIFIDEVYPYNDSGGYIKLKDCKYGVTYASTIQEFEGRCLRPALDRGMAVIVTIGDPWVSGNVVNGELSSGYKNLVRWLTGHPSGRVAVSLQCWRHARPGVEQDQSVELLADWLAQRPQDTVGRDINHRTYLWFAVKDFACGHSVLSSIEKFIDRQKVYLGLPRCTPHGVGFWTWGCSSNLDWTNHLNLQLSRWK